MFFNPLGLCLFRVFWWSWSCVFIYKNGNRHSIGLSISLALLIRNREPMATVDDRCWVSSMDMEGGEDLQIIHLLTLGGYSSPYEDVRVLVLVSCISRYLQSNYSKGVLLSYQKRSFLIRYMKTDFLSHRSYSPLSYLYVLLQYYSFRRLLVQPVSFNPSTLYHLGWYNVIVIRQLIKNHPWNQWNFSWCTF